MDDDRSVPAILVIALLCGFFTHLGEGAAQMILNYVGSRNSDDEDVEEGHEEEDILPGIHIHLHGTGLSPEPA